MERQKERHRSIGSRPALVGEIIQKKREGENRKHNTVEIRAKRVFVSFRLIVETGTLTLLSLCLEFPWHI